MRDLFVRAWNTCVAVFGMSSAAVQVAWNVRLGLDRSDVRHRARNVDEGFSGPVLDYSPSGHSGWYFEPQYLGPPILHVHSRFRQ